MGDPFGRLTTHHLRVFLAVAQQRSFTRAGAELSLTQAVMSGLGISCFSALTVRRELREKRLVRLPIRSLLLPRCFLFVHRRDKRVTPALGAFLDFLRDQPCHRE